MGCCERSLGVTRRMLWWGEGSAKGEAGQVGLEGCGEAPGLSPEGTGELWQILEQGKVRSVFWKGWSGCLMWEFGGCWGRDPGGRVPRDPGRDPAFGGRAVEGDPPIQHHCLAFGLFPASQALSPSYFSL